MSIGLQDDMFTPDVIADPYAYYGRLRDEDPVHWNETYELWVDHPPRRPGLADPASRAVFVRRVQERPAARLSGDRRVGSWTLRVCAELPGRPVHPARPAGPSGDAQGRARLLHAEIDGSLAAVRPEGGQGPARRGRGEGQHGRHARPGDAAAGAGDRRDDGRARGRPALHPRSWPRSCSISAAASTTG